MLLNVSCESQTPEIDALRVRAEAGDAGAQNDVGLNYSIGLGVPEDDAEAVRWFRLAAEQGDVTARCALWNRCAGCQGGQE